MKKDKLPKKSDGVKTEEAKKVKSPFSGETLEQFRKLLIGQKSLLKGDIDQMDDEALRKSSQESSGNLSNMPIHLADMGSDTYEQDFTLGRMESTVAEAQEIDEALERIDDKTYGVCENCSKGISEARLRAIPYARLCVNCQGKDETGRK